MKTNTWHGEPCSSCTFAFKAATCPVGTCECRHRSPRTLLANTPHGNIPVTIFPTMAMGEGCGDHKPVVRTGEPEGPANG